MSTVDHGASGVGTDPESGATAAGGLSPDAVRHVGVPPAAPPAAQPAAPPAAGGTPAQPPAPAEEAEQEDGAQMVSPRPPEGMEFRPAFPS